MTERTDVFSSLLGTDIDFIRTDLAIVSVVNVCQIVYIFHATISFFQFSWRIELHHIVRGLPVQVDLGIVVNGLNDCHF